MYVCVYYFSLFFSFFAVAFDYAPRLRLVSFFLSFFSHTRGSVSSCLSSRPSLIQFLHRAPTHPPAIMVGKLPVKPSRFVEAWAARKEVIEHEFNPFTWQNLALVGAMGFMIPTMIYRAVVADYVSGRGGERERECKCTYVCLECAIE